LWRCLLKLGRNLEAVEDARKAVERSRYSIVALEALGEYPVDETSRELMALSPKLMVIRVQSP
jgi:hypothetical protein